MDDAVRQAERAVLWFGGQLPAGEQAKGYSVHVLGPGSSPVDPDFHTYHTFACLYPNRGMYSVMNPERGVKPAHRRVTDTEVRDVIAGFTPSREHVQEQRTQAGVVLPLTSFTVRWNAALAVGSILELPVAVMAFGHNRNGQLVVDQKSLLPAPLNKVAATFKRAAPHVIPN
jgi:hypothetical protein